MLILSKTNIYIYGIQCLYFRKLIYIYLWHPMLILSKTNIYIYGIQCLYFRKLIYIFMASNAYTFEN